MGATFISRAEPAADVHPFALLLLCALPAALVGLTEDLTKAIRARWRLLAPLLGSVLAMATLGATVPRLGVPWLEGLLQYWPVAAGITLLMVVGFTQAINIVDGLNGLASGVSILMLLATAWVAHAAGDAFILQASLILAAATLGFFCVNFPRGLMFLGDGGAYFLGFTQAVLWILLLVRNPGEVSPWCVMAIAAHPTIETIFSIVRRRFLHQRARNATAPDRLHLHTLVFRRRTRPLLTPRQRRAAPWAMNALAAALMLVGIGMFVALAGVDPAGSLWNLAVLAAAVLFYLYQFKRITGLHGSWWMRPARRARPMASRFGQQGQA